jgi:hypothetical protein
MDCTVCNHAGVWQTGILRTIFGVLSSCDTWWSVFRITVEIPGRWRRKRRKEVTVIKRKLTVVAKSDRAMAALWLFHQVMPFPVIFFVGRTCSDDNRSGTRQCTICCTSFSLVSFFSCRWLVLGGQTTSSWGKACEEESMLRMAPHKEKV